MIPSVADSQIPSDPGYADRFVTAGTSWQSVADTYGVTIESLLQANGQYLAIEPKNPINKTQGQTVHVPFTSCDCEDWYRDHEKERRARLTDFYSNEPITLINDSRLKFGKELRANEVVWKHCQRYAPNQSTACE